MNIFYITYLNILQIKQCTSNTVYCLSVCLDIDSTDQKLLVYVFLKCVEKYHTKHMPLNLENTNYIVVTSLPKQSIMGLLCPLLISGWIIFITSSLTLDLSNPNDDTNDHQLGGVDGGLDTVLATLPCFCTIKMQSTSTLMSVKR